MTDRPLSMSVSMSRKVNLERVLGPKYRYEAAEVFVSISNVTADTTSAEIAALLIPGGIAWAEAKAALASSVDDAVRDLRRKAATDEDPA